MIAVLISLLVWLVVLGVVVYLVQLFLGMLPLQPQVRQIITVVLGLIVLLLVLEHFLPLLTSGAHAL
jgi:hypothetical protein